MKLLFYSIIPAILIACSGSTNEPDNKPTTAEPTDSFEPVERTVDFGYERFFQSPEADSLLVDMMVYVYRKPDGLLWNERFDRKHRGYYIARLGLFEHAYLHLQEDGSFLYYILRPGRQENNRTVRGVGGVMTIDEGSIVDFEETFNTRVGSRDEILDIGYQIMLDWAKTGTWERFADDRNYVEWPDDRLKYNKERHEWRYDD